MKGIYTRLEGSPVLVRVAPFVLFILLTALQGKFGEASRYWIYLGKTLVGAWLIWWIWPLVREMRWKLSWEAVLVGVAVFVMWVGIDPFYPKWGNESQGWNPFAQFDGDSTLAWMLFIGRLAGSTLVVPPLEEMFYRSFLYRYIEKADFLSVPMGRFEWKPFLITAAIFGAAHHEWLAGVLCAFAYQGLVCWKKRLGDAITAHAITNFLLGLWVYWKSEWHFW